MSPFREKQDFFFLETGNDLSLASHP